MQFPCFIPLVADADDNRSFRPPHNNSCLLIFTEELLLNQYIRDSKNVKTMRMTIDNPKDLIAMVNKASRSGRFHSVLLDLGQEPNGPGPEAIAQFVSRLEADDQLQ